MNAEISKLYRCVNVGGGIMSKQLKSSRNKVESLMTAVGKESEQL